MNLSRWEHNTKGNIQQKYTVTKELQTGRKSSDTFLKVDKATICRV